jgi:hypothetical protein
MGVVPSCTVDDGGIVSGKVGMIRRVENRE